MLLKEIIWLIQLSLNHGKHLTFLRSAVLVRNREYVLFLNLCIFFMILLFSFGWKCTSNCKIIVFIQTPLMMKKTMFKCQPDIVFISHCKHTYIISFHGVGKVREKKKKNLWWMLNLSSYSRIYFCSLEEIQHLPYNQRININC